MYLLEEYKDFPPDLQKYVPDYEFFLYDVSGYKDENVQLNVFLRIILMVFSGYPQKGYPRRGKYHLSGRAEGIANTTIRLITKFVAPPSEDIKKKIHEQEISTLEAIVDHIDELKTIEDVKQYLK
ncbi:hypothetical protein [Oceanobacillus sp. FSL W7-1281]|uniref:hypothetical protein n=1 Tax=Oceanobacillus sp. FSL W7-1281 TaxID=2921698 RepID=UPI0030DDAF0F